MDMSKYCAHRYIKVDDVRDGPIQERIVAFGLGKYDRPVLEFENGDSLTLNSTNVRTLIKAYGNDGEDWIGQVIELTLGNTTFEGESIKSVIARPISSPTHYGPKAVSPIVPQEDKSSLPQTDQQEAFGAEMDDEIPF